MDVGTCVISKLIRVSCEGGALGAGWTSEVNWAPQKSGYKISMKQDSIVTNSDKFRRRKSRPLTLRAIVEDCQRLPEVRFYGDLYDAVAVQGFSNWEADVVKLAVVEDEDQPVSQSLLNYLLAQDSDVLKRLRQAYGPLWTTKAREVIGELSSWQSQLGLPQHLLEAGEKIGGKPSNRLSELRRLIRKSYATHGFKILLNKVISKKGLVGFWESEPRPIPNTSLEWAHLLECALNEQIFEDDNPTSTVPPMDFLQWLIDVMTPRKFAQLKRDKLPVLERFSSTASAYVRRAHDPTSTGGGGGWRIKHQRDEIHAAFVSGRWSVGIQQ